MNYLSRRLLFVSLLLTACGMMVAAMPGNTTPVIEKLSITTQMFLDEMQGNISFDETRAHAFNMPGRVRLLQPVERRYASPETIDGKQYISAFVRITGDDVISTLEQMGVLIEETFENGLLTALIPVDGIHRIAAIPGVKRIDVATVMQEATDLARHATRVDDVIGFTAAAQAVNLPKGYDGSGVILGVIDRGIDFNHMAFRDKDGNTRIKRAYVYNGKSIYYYGMGDLPDDGVRNTDHGSHTSAIAGGSSIIVDGNDVTVTLDHDSATYGGMAPGTELYLCGLNGMTATRIANSFKRICNYADSVGKPVVVSNSYGDYVYNRDGGGEQGEIVAQLFGEDHPNRICLFATGNNAGHSGDKPGGVYVSGSSSIDAPLGTVICSTQLALDNGWQYYRGEFIAEAFTHADDATGIGAILYVLDATTGEAVNSYTFSTQSGNTSVTLGDYFTGYRSGTMVPEAATVTVYFDYKTANNKKQVIVYVPNGLSSDTYTLAIEVYPIGGSSDVIDMWSCGTYTYFDSHLSTEDHNWTTGTDDMSVMPNACYPQAISVGAYVTRTREGSNQVGDISNFSCYAVEGTGPLGDIHPWIAAPGEDIISAFNHFVTHSDMSDVIVNNPTSPYGLMSGTSMATPMAAGIVALWMQAATECGKQLTPGEVKTIMKETAVRDTWVTDGPHATHFGNGKIDALAGIEYILREYGGNQHTPGDVNHDGEISVTDLTLLIDHLLGLQPDICTTCGDINSDTIFNIADVTAIIDLLLNEQ